MKIIKKLGLAIILSVSVLLLSGCSSTSSQSKLPDKFLNDKAAMENSLKKFGESSDITNGLNGKESDGQTQKVLALTAESIDSGKKVSDEFLDYLSPNLKQNYRDKFIKGQELFFKGLSQSKSNDSINSESVKNQIAGSNLVSEWLVWWKINNKEILDKIFPN